MIATTIANYEIWAFFMIQVLPHEVFTRMAVTHWAVWTARWKLIQEGVNQSPHSTHLFVTQFIAEFEQIKVKAWNGGGVGLGWMWQSLPWGRGGFRLQRNLWNWMLMLEFQEQETEVQVMWYVSDQDGVYLRSFAILVPALYDHAWFEALACPETLPPEKDLGIQNRFKAPDCKMVIKDIHDGAGGNYGLVITEIRN